MGDVGAWAIALIVLVILLIFGPKRLPQMGRSLGRGMREFKDSVLGTTQEIKEATVDTPKQFKAALNPLASFDMKTEAPAQTVQAAPVAAAPAPLGPVQPAVAAAAATARARG